MLLSKSFKTASLLVIGLFLLSACSSKQDKLKQKQAALYFGAGTQDLMQKQYTEALKNLMEADRLQPKDPEILNNLAMAYYFKGEKEIAVRYLESVLKLDAKNSDAKINLASIYYKEGRFDEAEKLYKKVLTDLTYDKQARTYFNLALIQLQARKNAVAAENYFKKAIKEDDNYCPAYFHLGLLNYKRRQFKSALKNLKEASMGTCFETPAPHYYQALSLIELGRFDDARLKLDEIDTRFKQSVYAVKARSKAIEINELENRKSPESMASRKMLETPEF